MPNKSSVFERETRVSTIWVIESSDGLSESGYAAADFGHKRAGMPLNRNLGLIIMINVYVYVHAKYFM